MPPGYADTVTDTARQSALMPLEGTRLVTGMGMPGMKWGGKLAGKPGSVVGQPFL